MGATCIPEVVSSVHWMCKAEVSVHHQYIEYGWHLYSWSCVIWAGSMGATCNTEVVSPVQGVWVPLVTLKLYHQYNEYRSYLYSWSCVISTVNMGATCKADVVSPLQSQKCRVPKYGSLKLCPQFREYGYSCNAEVVSHVQKMWVSLVQLKLYHQYSKYGCHL